MNEIEQALTRIFERQRIVFWYDDKRELQAEFEALALPGVEKITLANNAFGVKHRILREQPRQKFLLYHAGPAPQKLDNWLLDVQLAHGEFRADQVALWLSELGLSLDFDTAIAPHAEFFKAAARRADLKTRLKKGDGHRQIHLKMLAVCARSEARDGDILKHLLGELAAGRDERQRLIRRCALDGLLWDLLLRSYDYTSESPGLRDFVITLFKSCYALALGEQAALNNDAMVFLKHWKDSSQHQEAFGTLSAECAAPLNIAADAQSRQLDELLEVDFFELIDQKILSDMARAITARTLLASKVAQIIRQRRSSYWYDNYQHEYAALAEAATFMETLESVDLTLHAGADNAGEHAVAQYAATWYQLDQRYRKFIYHMRQSGNINLLGALAESVENRYSNNYLLPLNNRWQAVVDARARWVWPMQLSQSDFFELRVAPVLARKKKIFVIISDGLRYEIGEELARRIRGEERYDVTLEPALTLLPSYTQLGMAALLPHTSLEISGDGSKVLVNGKSSVGTENRSKLLNQPSSARATALQAKDLLAMNKEERRVLFHDHDVVYIYHNRIDATGDKRDSEERVFDAAEATLEELVSVVKKLAGANVSNMLITADHGFIYQNRPLDESDFAGQEARGALISKTDRRYVLGKGLVESSSFKHFSAAQMGLAGDSEMLIPKSINRLRVKGAGSRYVHGGAALQEIVIPVLRINKKRAGDTRQVAVDILAAATAVITAGQLSVTFYQSEPVTEKVHARRLFAGIYSQDNVLISQRHELLFDLASANPREREMRVRFILTQEADIVNEQDVTLRLEEQIPGTSHYQEYKIARYTLRRAFSSDFDL